jgi:hypothetical protein
MSNYFEPTEREGYSFKETSAFLRELCPHLLEEMADRLVAMNLSLGEYALADGMDELLSLQSDERHVWVEKVVEGMVSLWSFIWPTIVLIFFHFSNR